MKVITKPVDITEGIESKNEELTLLWLDDRINPLDSRMDWLAYSPLGREVNVVWIKSYSEFRRWLELNGQPDGICFDYNLGINVPTGYDCAQYLISYCRRNKLKLPVWSSQCPNPVEKAKINRLLKSALAVSEH
ncbi:cyclic-phosphate processing receiver domain-containing protein [Christiangramia echinicola]|uniref:cyclic-phosphate processing receiver domain-containing protein n=1 Tax=Christiangramia echinicola TaxID=279359 RepID=UPI001969FE08|nr:cyclic-phosphate processing receiver domain-containing protein [Christiangramia echinicola]